MPGDQPSAIEPFVNQRGHEHHEAPRRWSTDVAQDIWSPFEHQTKSSSSMPVHNRPNTRDDGRALEHRKPALENLTMHPIFAPSSAKTDAQLQEKVAEIASHAAGKKMYLPREGSPYKGYQITPTFGCTSASTNLLFDGLKAAGRVSDADYHNVHQIANERAYTMLQKEHLAKPVPTKDIQPGDWVYFKDKGESSGHSGVVFRDKHGELMVANNTSGKIMNDSLKGMIDDYDTTRALRPILASEHHKEHQSKPQIAPKLFF